MNHTVLSQYFASHMNVIEGGAPMIELYGYIQNLDHFSACKLLAKMLMTSDNKTTTLTAF